MEVNRETVPRSSPGRWETLFSNFRLSPKLDVVIGIGGPQAFSPLDEPTDCEAWTVWAWAALTRWKTQQACSNGCNCFDAGVTWSRRHALRFSRAVTLWSRYNVLMVDFGSLGVLNCNNLVIDCAMASFQTSCQTWRLLRSCKCTL